MNKTIAAAVLTIALPVSAQAWWGGPYNNAGNGWGNGWGDGDMSFSMNARARGNANGYNNYYNGYAPYGYAPYGYAPYGYAPVAPVAPQHNADTAKTEDKTTTAAAPRQATAPVAPAAPYGYPRYGYPYGDSGNFFGNGWGDGDMSFSFNGRGRGNANGYNNYYNGYAPYGYAPYGHGPYGYGYAPAAPVARADK